MFGYVKPYHPELLVKDYEFYRATYCGICRSMKKHTGVLSNVTLSYDSVLLALVRMLYIPDSEIGAKARAVYSVAGFSFSIHRFFAGCAMHLFFIADISESGI